MIFLKMDFLGDIGLLSINIDGNDYWIWKGIDVINPAIVVIEYNSIIGKSHPITIRYKNSFTRHGEHASEHFHEHHFLHLLN